ncbi:TetR/AcrR family transcriptional regulator [Pseudomonas protegens]|uniref:TetR/AcrR family transcriptional regulator n=1 Tax=Pseudomonas protegens TaxID=380021 RepID=UPI000F4AF6A2|nr:TetR/AcrR family transcriptional regulator [Pseudomonas protegens]
MRKLTRNHWVATGFEALDQVGHTGVSAESLARRLNVTRGSFYHHFRNREDFVRTLLGAWEEDYTGRMLAYAVEGRSAGETLKRYLNIASEKQPGREVSIRAWSRHDPLVAEFQQRVDATRLAFAVRTCRQLVHLPGEAEIIGQVAHLCLIGGQQTGLRRDAARFNSFLQRAFGLFEGAPPPRRT